MNEKNFCIHIYRDEEDYKFVFLLFYTSRKDKRGKRKNSLPNDILTIQLVFFSSFEAASFTSIHDKPQ